MKNKYMYLPVSGLWEGCSGHSHGVPTPGGGCHLPRLFLPGLTHHLLLQGLEAVGGRPLQGCGVGQGFSCLPQHGQGV